MAHGTRINGTAYGIDGGKCLVNGTSYSIQGGRTLVNGTGYDIAFFDGYKIVVTNSDGSEIQDMSAAVLRINGTAEYNEDGEFIEIINDRELTINTGTFYGAGVCQFAVFLIRGKLYINGVSTPLEQYQYVYRITTNITIDITYSTSIGVVVRITEQ